MDKPPIFWATRRPAPQSCEELAARAAALEGADVGRLAAALGAAVPEHSRHAKGFVGQLVECALGADPKAGSSPDFPALGVELKTVPINAMGLPMESTFCCAIHMATADAQVWESSRLRQRLRHVLWLPVTGARLAPLAQRRFGRARLWRLEGADESMLREDWECLMGHIGAGLVGTLSAHMGEALQVRPKAAHARVRTLAPGPEGYAACLPLGFYLRTRFTARIIRPD